jgi:hypothetical protein
MTAIVWWGIKRPIWTLSELWPAIVGFLAAAAILSGIEGLLPGVYAAEFRFKPELHTLVPDGRFAVLGENGTTLYLQECQRASGQTLNRNQIVAIQESEVLLAMAPRQGFEVGPNLLGELANHRFSVPLGFRSPC